MQPGGYEGQSSWNTVESWTSHKWGSCGTRWGTTRWETNNWGTSSWHAGNGRQSEWDVDSWEASSREACSWDDTLDWFEHEWQRHGDDLWSSAYVNSGGNAGASPPSGLGALDVELDTLVRQDARESGPTGSFDAVSLDADVAGYMTHRNCTTFITNASSCGTARSTSEALDVELDVLVRQNAQNSGGNDLLDAALDVYMNGPGTGRSGHRASGRQEFVDDELGSLANRPASSNDTGIADRNRSNHRRNAGEIAGAGSAVEWLNMPLGALVKRRRLEQEQRPNAAEEANGQRLDEELDAYMSCGTTPGSAADPAPDMCSRARARNAESAAAASAHVEAPVASVVSRAGDCVVCMCSVATHILVPCGHQALCRECAQRYALSLARGLRCPCCRSAIRDVIQVFVPAPRSTLAQAVGQEQREPTSKPSEPSSSADELINMGFSALASRTALETSGANVPAAGGHALH